MCEIYGFCGNKQEKLNQYTDEFWSHANIHKDGFGYYLVDNDDYFISKESAADNLQTLKRKNFKSKLALCHIRFKTHGPTAIENCHPFIKQDIKGIQWSLIHNGYISDNADTMSLGEIQKGETDSERILLYLVETVNSFYEHAWILNPSEYMFQLYAQLEYACNELSRLGKTNLIFTDSLTNNMYVYMNHANTLYYLKDSCGYHISTTKLSNDAGWSPIQPHRLYIINNGEVVEY